MPGVPRPKSRKGVPCRAANAGSSPPDGDPSVRCWVVTVTVRSLIFVSSALTNARKLPIASRCAVVMASHFVAISS